MMNYILFDDSAHVQLLPLTFTRPVCEIRIGILTIREKWELALNCTASTATAEYLSGKYPLVTAERNVWINGSVCPDKGLIAAVRNLSDGDRLVAGDKLLAVCQDGAAKADLKNISGIAYRQGFLSIEHPWDIFAKNGEALERDFEAITSGRQSGPLSETDRKSVV